MKTTRIRIFAASIALTALLVACDEPPTPTERAEQTPAVLPIDQDPVESRAATAPVSRAVQPVQAVTPTTAVAPVAPTPVVDDRDETAPLAVQPSRSLPAATPTAPNLSNGR